MSAQDLNQKSIDLMFAAAEADQQFTSVNFKTRKSLTPDQMQLPQDTCLLYH